MTEEKAKYEVIDYDGDLKGGQEARRYPDGSIRNEKGYMLQPLKGGGIQSSEQARELVQLKKEKHQEAFRRGLKRAAGVDEKSLDSEELTVYAEHAGTQFLESKNIRGMSEILGRFASLGGYAMENTQELKGGGNVVPSILQELGAEMVKHIIQRAHERTT